MKTKFIAPAYLEVTSDDDCQMLTLQDIEDEIISLEDKIVYLERAKQLLKFYKQAKVKLEKSILKENK